MLPPSAIARLSKAIVRIQGPDATKFLNGLVTARMLPSIEKKKQLTFTDADKDFDLLDHIDALENYGIIHEDIYDPERTLFVRRDGLSLMFLSLKGRVLWDCFVYPDPFVQEELKSTLSKVMGSTQFNHSNPSYLVEVDRKYVDSLQGVLKLHKLGAKVKIIPTELQLIYYYNDSAVFDDWLEDLQSRFFATYTPKEAAMASAELVRNGELFNPSSESIAFAIDNRIPNFGLKFIGNWSSGTSLEDVTPQIFSKPFLDSFGRPNPAIERQITQRRYVNGLFESLDSTSKHPLLPFEVNLDFTNGLSLEKGCYVGQELTTRTYNGGVIRKRVFPVEFFDISHIESAESSDGIHLAALEDGDEISQLMARVLEKGLLDEIEVKPLKEPEIKAPQKPLAASPFDKSQGSSGSSPFENSSTGISRRKRNKSVGKILSIQDNLGFMLVNSTDIEESRFFKIEVELERGKREIGVKVNTPDWWPDF